MPVAIAFIGGENPVMAEDAVIVPVKTASRWDMFQGEQSDGTALLAQGAP
jgi:hypothetical protein